MAEHEWRQQMVSFAVFASSGGIIAPVTWQLGVTQVVVVGLGHICVVVSGDVAQGSHRWHVHATGAIRESHRWRCGHVVRIVLTVRPRRR